jgi:adenylate cyclase
LHDGRVEFVSPHETIPQPAVVFAGIRDSGRLAEARAGAMQGEISLAGQRHAFVLAPSDELTWFRPLLAVSLEPGFGVVRQRWRRLIVTGVAAMVPVIFLGLILSAGLLGPMAELEKAVQRIRRGELKQRLPVFGTNELSVLNHCWNEMAASLEERERMRSFVSGAVLRAVREETMTTSRRGQLCEATILFTHIKDFAPLSAGMAPAQLFSLLNEFLAGAERCIRAFDGEVDKFIGDAVMAVFTHKGHERAAVRAAAAITDFVRQYNLAASAGGKPAIRIGIGINTGNVMMGDVGSSRRKELTVIGDAVNLAARLESVSESGRSTRIMISGETFDRLESEIHARLLPLAQVKGKQETVRIFEFEGPRNGGTI